MSEWWTYRLSDFLMFSPAVYARMVERYHRELAPLPWLLLALGLGLVALAVLRKPWAARAVLLVLAVLWTWVGWAFLWQRYAQINWAAQHMAVAWWLQAALLVAAAWAPVTQRSAQAVGYLGLALAAAGVLGYAAHGQAFGLMPGPTALATLGLLFTLRPRGMPWLCGLPVLALVAEALTLWMFHTPG